MVKIGLDKTVEEYLPERLGCTKYPEDGSKNWLGCIKEHTE